MIVLAFLNSTILFHLNVYLLYFAKMAKTAQGLHHDVSLLELEDN